MEKSERCYWKECLISENTPTVYVALENRLVFPHYSLSAELFQLRT